MRTTGTVDNRNNYEKKRSVKLWASQQNHPCCGKHRFQVVLPRHSCKAQLYSLSLLFIVAMANRSDSWSRSVSPRRIKWSCSAWASAGLTIMWGAGMTTGSKHSSWWTASHITQEEEQKCKRLLSTIHTCYTKYNVLWKLQSPPKLYCDLFPCTIIKISISVSSPGARQTRQGEQWLG